MTTAYYIIIAVATVLMLLGILIAIRLKRTAADGAHKKSVSIITTLTMFLTGVYCSSAILPLLSIEFSLVIMGLILVFGSAYVLGMLWLIRRLLKETQ